MDPISSKPDAVPPATADEYAKLMARLKVNPSPAGGSGTLPSSYEAALKRHGGGEAATKAGTAAPAAAPTAPATGPATEAAVTTAEKVAPKSLSLMGRAGAFIARFAGPANVVTAGAMDGIDAYQSYNKGDVRGGRISTAGAVGATVAAGAATAAIAIFAAPAALVTLTGIAAVTAVGMAGSYAAKAIAAPFVGDGKSDAQHQKEYDQSFAKYREAVIAERIAGAGATKDQHEAVAKTKDAFIDARSHVVRESDKMLAAKAAEFQTLFVKEADAQMQADAKKHSDELIARAKGATPEAAAAAAAAGIVARAQATSPEDAVKKADEDLRKAYLAQAQHPATTEAEKKAQQDAINKAGATFVVAGEAFLVSRGASKEEAHAKAAEVMSATAQAYYKEAHPTAPTAPTRSATVTTATGGTSSGKLEGDTYHIGEGETLSGIAARVKDQLGDKLKNVDTMTLAAAIALENKVHNIDKIDKGADLKLSSDRLLARVAELEASGVSHDGKVAYADVKGRDVAELVRPGQTPRTLAGGVPVRAN